MADKNIGALPQAAQLDDSSLLVAEQQGQAVKITGAQFKEFGRQAVVGQVQGYVDQAEAAADRAEGAVRSVEDMTVEAAALPAGQEAAVTKTIRAGKVHLAFGLPRGEQGVPGPEGKQGQRGPKGDPGTGLKILGYYDSLPALEAAVPSPSVGDAYGVGTEVPYSIYVFDGASSTWKDNGQLSGGGGGVLPENVVTTEGGASIEIPAGLGDGPHTITFVDEEEPALTAEDIEYSGGQTVKEAMDGLFTSVSDGKAAVASAITDKGVPTAQDADFSTLAEHIRSISSGTETSDATATPGDILSPKTAYTAAGKVEGLIPSLAAQTIMPGTADKTIASGQYLRGTQTIRGDTNLTSGNIKKGVTLFGVIGALESSFRATLTVKADIGAVVTAKNGDTEVSALSTTGTVVLELPIEGTWKVTAVRGVAQYNTVTLQVSSQYSAQLTAEVHIEYWGRAASLHTATANFAGASTKDYAIFAGAKTGSYTGDVYSKTLTKSIIVFSEKYHTYSNAGASAGDNAVFCGGYGSPHGYSAQSIFVNNELTKTSLFSDSASKAGASFGAYAVFFGGYMGAAKYDASVVFCDDSAVKTEAPNSLPTPGKGAAAANNNYAMFCASSHTAVIAYDSHMTQNMPSSLTGVTDYISAVRAGNYVIFITSDNCYAYDLFLTRTLVEPLRLSRDYKMCTTINHMAMIAGGSYYDSESRKRVFTGVVDIYDSMLSRLATEDTYARADGAAATVGDYALFAGGTTRLNIAGTYDETSIVDVYRYV